MNALILVPILLLLVTGAVGLVLGRKGINTKTLVGAWLVLFSACGFIYLAGRVAERERAWRFEIRELQKQIATKAGGPFAGKKVFLGDPADDLSPAEKAWREDAASKLLAAGGEAVMELSKKIDFFVADASGEAPPEAEELEIEVLDRADFISDVKKSLDGLSKTVAEKQREQIAVETWRNRFWTSSSFEPPSKTDDEATIKLDVSGDTEQPLNVGAELAIFFLEGDDEEFRRTAKELSENLEPKSFLGIFVVRSIEPVTGTSLSLKVVPVTTPDNFDQKAWQAWRKAGRFAEEPALLVFEDLPTNRWAAAIKHEDRVAADEKIVVVPLEQALKSLADGESLPGEYWATVTIKNAAALEGVPEGQSLELDLQTAQELQQDDAVSIEKVIRRRLLTDPLTALRGTRFETMERGDVPAAGIEGIRRKLTAELSSLTLMTDRIGTARQATDRENQSKQETATALAEDKTAWEEDLDFAKRALNRLAERVERTDAELRETRRAIVQKRAELRELTAQIMAKSRPSAERPALGGPAARSAAVP